MPHTSHVFYINYSRYVVWWSGLVIGETPPHNIQNLLARQNVVVRTVQYECFGKVLCTIHIHIL